jgi:hypothetical protein
MPIFLPTIGRKYFKIIKILTPSRCGFIFCQEAHNRPMPVVGCPGGTPMCSPRYLFGKIFIFEKLKIVFLKDAKRMFRLALF